MIIDSHQHAYYHGLNPAGVIAKMDEFGIDVTWLLTWYLPPAEDAPGSCRAFNQLLLTSSSLSAKIAHRLETLNLTLKSRFSVAGIELSIYHVLFFTFQT